MSYLNNVVPLVVLYALRRLYTGFGAGVYEKQKVVKVIAQLAGILKYIDREGGEIMN